MRPTKLKPEQEFGYVTLVEKLKEKDKHGGFLWKCNCVCGKEKIVSSRRVRRGDSCGCMNIFYRESKSLSNSKFGRLLVIKRLHYDNGYRYYLCKCDCGTEKVLSSANLNGGTRSCGCLAEEYGVKKRPFGESAFNALYSTYLWRAKRKKQLIFDIDKDYFRQLTQQNCYYCGAHPEQVYKPKRANGHYVYNGIDRIDSSEGYSAKNCVSCCGKCNKMKMNFTKEEFISHVRLICHHQNLVLGEKYG